MVASGDFCDIPGYDPDGEGFWEPFDNYFEVEFGISPSEWVVG